jgi:hypothetical protein
MIANAIRRAGNTRWALIGLLLGLPLPIVILVWIFAGR